MTVTDEQLHDWARLAKKPWIDVGIRLPDVVPLLIQEIRQLRSADAGFWDEQVERARKTEREGRLKAETEVERLREALALDDPPPKAAQFKELLVQRDGLRDELTVALAKATDLVAERDALQVRLNHKTNDYLNAVEDRHKSDKLRLEIQAERDRYRQTLDAIIRMAEEPHLQIARAAEIARTTLNQEGGELKKATP